MTRYDTMNAIKKVLLLNSSIMLAGFLLGNFIATGCKSPAQTAYVVGQGTTITVEAAMGLWNQHVGEKHPGAAVEQRVKTAYDQYRAADIALLTAGKAMLEADAKGSAAQTTASKAWHEAEAALTASAGQVYSLLRELGVKLPP